MKAGEYKDMPMPFGKHKGTLIADLEDSYLIWLLDQEWVHKSYPALVKQLKIEDQYRKKFNNG